MTASASQVHDVRILGGRNQTAWRGVTQERDSLQAARGKSRRGFVRRTSLSPRRVRMLRIMRNNISFIAERAELPGCRSAMHCTAG